MTADELGDEIKALFETEKQARQKAQAEVEKLKGVIVKAGLEIQSDVLAERESCEKVCDVYGQVNCAKHIRMRGEL